MNVFGIRVVEIREFGRPVVVTRSRGKWLGVLTAPADHLRARERHSVFVVGCRGPARVFYLVFVEHLSRLVAVLLFCCFVVLLFACVRVRQWLIYTSGEQGMAWQGTYQVATLGVVGAICLTSLCFASCSKTVESPAPSAVTPKKPTMARLCELLVARAVAIDVQGGARREKKRSYQGG